MRAVIMLPVACLLSGCSSWQGPAFYSRAEAVIPFPPGQYVSGDKHVPGSIRWDGQHVIDGRHSISRDDKKLLQGWIAVPLSEAGKDVFVLQFAPAQDGMAVYGLLNRRGDKYRVDLPTCSSTKEIARSAGALIESDAVESDAATSIAGQKQGRGKPGARYLEFGKAETVSCIFRTRASLETAARRYIKERQMLGVVLQWVGN